MVRDPARAIDEISRLERVDFRWLDKQTIEEFRSLFDQMYNSEKLSTTEIGERLGKSQQFAWSMCKRLGINLRSRVDGGRLYAPKRTPNIRKPFTGSKFDIAYMQGFARGDLDVRRKSSLAIIVSTTTTHPDFVSLFTSLFQGFGPVYVYPTHDETSGYRWKVAARLDNSFSFLLPERNPRKPSFETKREYLAWLAGFVDADGSVGIIHSGKYVRLNLTLANQDATLLIHVKKELIRWGYSPTGPYLSYPKGYRTPVRRAKYNKDMYYLLMQRSTEVRDILPSLPLRHGEKRRRRALALSLPAPARWEEVGVRIESLRAQIDGEVVKYVKEAEHEFRRRIHKKRRESPTS